MLIIIGAMACEDGMEQGVIYGSPIPGSLPCSPCPWAELHLLEGMHAQQWNQEYTPAPSMDSIQCTRIIVMFLLVQYTICRWTNICEVLIVSPYRSSRRCFGCVLDLTCTYWPYKCIDTWWSLVERTPVRNMNRTYSMRSRSDQTTASDTSIRSRIEW